MNLSRRGFFKGVAALAAGVVAAQLPSCSAGGMTPAEAAVPTRPKVTRATLRKISSELNKNAVGTTPLPYSLVPLVEGLTPTLATLPAPGPRVD